MIMYGNVRATQTVAYCGRASSNARQKVAWGNVAQAACIRGYKCVIHSLMQEAGMPTPDLALLVGGNGKPAP